ncbi:MAG: Mur ligase family protein, partial [Gammaproteobacteria bacterium]
TNIDADHLETYDGDYDRLSETFLEFLQRLPFYGLAVLCVDDKGVRQIIDDIAKPFVTYGIDNEADFRATDIRFDRTHTSFRISGPDRQEWLQINLNLPGKHNVLNALGAVAIAAAVGVTDASIMKALQEFQGIARRCHVMGDIHLADKKVMVIDDYAHHPSEIRAILDAVRTGWPDTRIVAVFQPHRYTRTRDLFSEFCSVLAGIEVLILMNVYPAGEPPVTGADSQTLCEAIAGHGKSKPVRVDNREQLLTELPGIVEDGDILLIMGAGDIGSLGPELLAQYGNNEHQASAN